MKHLLKSLFLLSLLISIGACSHVDSSVADTSSNKSASEVISSSKETKSSSSVSSNQTTSSDPALRNDELYNDNLSIKFDKRGARISSIKWKDKQIAKDGFTVGRCANRIANGKFTLNGKEYNVTKNNGQHSLHGGGSSWQGPFANANWTKVDQTLTTITYSLHSPDKEEGYPGNMDMTVKYTLSESGELSIEYSATTDADTLCNPTNHLFIAINGSENRSYPNIKLWIDADNYTPLSNQIPTGEIASVKGTQFDYSTEKAFDGSKNYDDNYVLNGEGYRKVATMTGTSLGIKVDVFTDRPGLQLYKDGNGSICLESQMLPDAINHDNFESPILKAGEQFYSKTSYAFSAVE
jgi:aldose 1-epimerase